MNTIDTQSFKVSRVHGHPSSLKVISGHLYYAIFISDFKPDFKTKRSVELSRTVELPNIRTVNSVFQFAECHSLRILTKIKKMSTKNIANFIKKIHEKPFLSGAKLRKVGDSFLVSFFIGNF